MARPENRSQQHYSSSMSNIFTKQGLLWITVLTLSTFILAVSSQSILVPPRLYAGQNNSLLLISNTTDSKATIRLLDGDTTLLEEKVRFAKDQIKEHLLFIDGRKQYKNAKIEVSFDNGYVPDQNIDIRPSGGVIFFQVDKPIYRPEETVKFRVLRLDSHMRALNETVKLTIFNHQNVKLDETVLQTEPPYYIANYSYNFPTISRSGIWTAEVHYGPNFESKETVSFELSDYRLPKFKANVQTPKYILKSKSSEIGVKINIDYIYDRKLNGTVYLRIGFMKGNEFIPKRTTNTQCFHGGYYSTNFTVEEQLWKEILNQPKRLIYIEAIIRDCSTNQAQNFLSEKIMIVESPYVLSTENTIKHYKNRSPNHIIVEVTDPAGAPVPGVPLVIDIRIRNGSKRIGENILSENRPVTDKDGRYVSTFKLDHVGIIDVSVRTNSPDFTPEQQPIENFSMEEFNPKENHFVYIVNRTKLDFKAGDVFKSQIDTDHYQFASLFLVVSSKGNVFHHEKLQNYTFQFNITNQMVPSIRVLILGLKRDSKIVSDFVRLNVKQHNCGPKVWLGSSKTAFPGSSVIFNVHGQVGDVVGMHAIDEAVFVMTNSNHNSSFRQLERALKETDVGCGPGSGRTSADIIQNAGFMVLSSSESNSKVYPSNFCNRENNKRHRSKYSPIERIKREVQMIKRDQQCCEMGQKKYLINRSCDKKSKIIEKHFDARCALRFKECCQKSATPTHAASAPTPDVHRRRLTVVNTASVMSGVYKNNNGESSEQKESFEPLNMEDVPHQVRTDFRETWLFDMFVLNDVEKRLDVPAPHSITSWAVSTLSLSKRNGFCHSNDIRLTTFKEFFVEISLPRRLVEFEQTELVVNVYNYRATNLMISVKFFRVDGICSNWGQNRDYHHENGSIEAGSSKRFHIPILPYKRGNFQIKVQAESNIKGESYSDTVIKNLTVVAPGIEKIESIGFVIDPSKKDKRSTQVLNNITVVQMIPSKNEHLTNVTLRNDRFDNSNVVPNTLKYVLSASGQSFTPNVKTNDEMLKYVRRPYGDGMNNINMMAHNLYAMMYLNHTNKLEDKTKSEAITLIRRSLNYQMTYRNGDGSFYIFNGSKKPAQQFTAYVVKVFCQAAPYVGPKIMDPSIIFLTLKFLSSTQNMDGSWTEIDPFSGDEPTVDSLDPISLTAYMLGALQQCSDYYNNNFEQSSIFSSDKYQTMIRKAEEFLKNRDQALLDDPYSPFKRSMLAYALSFGNNDEVSELLRSCLESSIHNIDKNEVFWSSFVERYPFDTAAFVLMALIKTDGDMKKMSGLFNWIAAQTEFEHFNRTIDTTLGLEAMSKYYSFFHSKKKTIHINLESNIHFNRRLRKQYHFDQTNADLTHILEVDPGTTDIGIVTRGFGVGRVQLQKTFNEFHSSDLCSFELTVKIYDYDIIFKQGIQNQTNISSNDVFNEPQKLKAAMDELNYNYTNLSSSPITCCYRASPVVVRRKKRSLRSNNLFKKVLSYFSRNQSPRNDQQNLDLLEPKRHGPDHPDENPDKRDFEGLFPELPKLHLAENGNIKVLNICSKHLQDTHLKASTALEVNLWSGYYLVPTDLEHIKNRSNFLSSYELYEQKVMFYFKHVPYTKAECLEFRIYEGEKVHNRQPAMIQIYEMSSKTVSCTRLYWQTEKTARTWNLKCKSDKLCECRTNKACPNSNTLGDNNLNKNSLSRASLSDIHRLFCTYKMAFIGIVESKNIGFNNQTHSMRVKVNESFYFGSNSPRNLNSGETFTVELNSQCNTHLKEAGSNVLVLHNSREDMLFDGDSVLFDLTEHNYKSILSSMSSIFRQGKSCPA